MKKSSKVIKANELLAVYYDSQHKKRLEKGEFLSFDIDEDIDFLKNKFDPHLETANVSIYNITKPIYRDDRKFLIGRVEPLNSTNSKVMFFEQYNNVWRLVDEAPVLGLEDPFYIEEVQGYHIVGGVHVFNTVYQEEPCYETYFYRYKKTLLELFDKKGKVFPPFAKGPERMKDIRLIDLKNGKIGVFTRPQGNSAGLGKIGYVEIDNLDQLGEAIPKARIIENLFHSDEWGGVNELHLLSGGKIGVLGHIAHFDGNVRHYYAMAFIFNPKTHKHSHMEILTTADDFPPLEPKTETLGKVVFSGGLQRCGDGTAYLYVGVGDRKAGKIKIKDPFALAEKVV